MSDYCPYCARDLDEGIDVDPNGEMKGQCAQCEAEQAIDFDVYPNAKVSRDGTVELNEDINMTTLTTKEYQQKLKDLNLSKDQQEILKEVLESLMAHYSRRGSHDNPYFDGTVSGVNSVHRFITNQIDCNDEFRGD